MAGSSLVRQQTDSPVALIAGARAACGAHELGSGAGVRERLDERRETVAIAMVPSSDELHCRAELEASLAQPVLAPRQASEDSNRALLRPCAQPRRSSQPRLRRSLVICCMTAASGM